MIKKLDFPKVEKIGIYAIRNKKNNKYYIGAASNIAARLEKHEVEIRLRNGINNKMINDLTDINDIEFLVLKTYDDGTITADELTAVETEYIERFNAVNEGYNTYTMISNCLGIIKSNKLIYARKRYDTFVVHLPKGTENKYKAVAEAKGMSLNGYITKLIEEDIKNSPAK